MGERLAVKVEGMTALLVEAVCCRTWLVSPFARIGRCGYCGERPVIVENSETLTKGDRQ